jgi:hypothetical protein
MVVAMNRKMGQGDFGEQRGEGVRESWWYMDVADEMNGVGATREATLQPIYGAGVISCVTARAIMRKKKHTVHTREYV